MESVLRPRDIQARIRAGEAPEDVAAAAQTSVDRIMGYATPVLAERAYQAQLAQRASVRRRAVAGAGGTAGNLGGAVTAHLETIDVDPESVEWDSWRREDGRWTVTASYRERGDERLARFAYDAAGRFVVAEDDEARALVGERLAAAPAAGHLSDATALADDVRSAVPETRTGEQLPLGDDALDVVMGVRPTAPAAPAPVQPDEVTIDLTETSHALRSPAPLRPAGDEDWISTQASERPAPSDTVEPDAPEPTGAPASEPWDSPGEEEPVEGDAREEEQEQSEALFEVPVPAATEPETSEQEPAATERAARSSRPKRRASVPSWDEIMFGSSASSGD